VRANDKTVEVINETRIARFGTRNGKVGSRAAIDARQFAHFFAVQTPQARVIQQLQQIFETLPRALAFVDKSVGR